MISKRMFVLTVGERTLEETFDSMNAMFDTTTEQVYLEHRSRRVDVDGRQFIFALPGSTTLDDALAGAKLLEEIGCVELAQPVGFVDEPEVIEVKA